MGDLRDDFHRYRHQRDLTLLYGHDVDGREGKLSVANLFESRAAIARRLISAAQKPLGDLSAVMATPPTITDPVSDAANSTVQAAQAYNAGMFSSLDATKVTPFGGPIINVNATAGNRIQTMTRQAGARLQGHSACIAFYTDAQVVDFALRCIGARWIAYVTTPDGVRARISAADRVQAFPNLNYYKLDFGSTAPSGRLIEIYTSLSGNFGGINVPTGYSIWPADLAYQPRMGVLWDSFGEGIMNDTTLNLKLAVADWLAGVFGCNNPYVNAVASTGVIATAGASNYSTFGARIAAGDFDASRIGHLDAIFALPSVNDGLTPNGGIVSPDGDAVVQSAYQAVIAALMIAQPRAIIFGASQQFNTIAAIASRTAAFRNGFAAAAQGDPRLIWLPGSLFESAPSVGVIGADSLHAAGVNGSRHIGERLARHGLTALKAMAA
jgi:hypothetical protein